METKSDFNCWLSPYGEVFECGCANHAHKANKIIEDVYHIDACEAILTSDMYSTTYDFLEDKGWWRFSNLYNDISRGEWVGRNRPTTDQKNKMFDLTGFIYEQ